MMLFQYKLNLSKTIYALHPCRCLCCNLPKPTHEIPKPKTQINTAHQIQHTPLSLEENGNPLAILEPRAPPPLPGAPGPQIHRFDERELHADMHPVGDRWERLLPLCRKLSSSAPEEGLYGLLGNAFHSHYQGAESSTALFRSSLVQLHLFPGRGIEGILVRIYTYI